MRRLRLLYCHVDCLVVSRVERTRLAISQGEQALSHAMDARFDD